MTVSESPTAGGYPDMVPVLDDGSVQLRPITEADVPAMVDYGSDPAIAQYTTVPQPYGRQDAQEFLDRVIRGWQRSDGGRTWAISEVGDTRLLGTLALDPRTANGTTAARIGDIGFLLTPAARGRGVMSAAIRLAVQHAFAQGLWGLPLVRVHWHALAGNLPSWRVAWACGFTPLAQVPQAVERPGHDVTDVWTASLGSDDDLDPQVPWLDVPELTGVKVRLRAWRESDAESRYAKGASLIGPAGAAPSSMSFHSWVTSAQFQAATGTALQWCVADPDDNAVGSAFIFSPTGVVSPPSAELGYFIHASARGQGYGREAAALATEYALSPDGLGLHRLTAVTSSENPASNAILAGLGFTQWGIAQRTEQLVSGAWADSYSWERSAD